MSGSLPAPADMLCTAGVALSPDRGSASSPEQLHLRRALLDAAECFIKRGFWSQGKLCRPGLRQDAPEQTQRENRVRTD